MELVYPDIAYHLESTRSSRRVKTPKEEAPSLCIQMQLDSMYSSLQAETARVRTLQNELELQDRVVKEQRRTIEDMLQNELVLQDRVVQEQRRTIDELKIEHTEARSKELQDLKADHALEVELLQQQVIIKEQQHTIEKLRSFGVQHAGGVSVIARQPERGTEHRNGRVRSAQQEIETRSQAERYDKERKPSACKEELPNEEHFVDFLNVTSNLIEGLHLCFTQEISNKRQENHRTKVTDICDNYKQWQSSKYTTVLDGLFKVRETFTKYRVSSEKAQHEIASQLRQAQKRREATMKATENSEKERDEAWEHFIKENKDMLQECVKKACTILKSPSCQEHMRNRFIVEEDKWWTCKLDKHLEQLKCARQLSSQNESLKDSRNACAMSFSKGIEKQAAFLNSSFGLQAGRVSRLMDEIVRLHVDLASVQNMMDAEVKKSGWLTQQVRDAQKIMGQRADLLNVVTVLVNKTDEQDLETTELGRNRQEQEKKIQELDFRIKLAGKLDPKLRAKLAMAKERHLQSLGKVTKRLRELHAEQEISVLKVIQAHKRMKNSEALWAQKLNSPSGAFFGSFNSLAVGTPSTKSASTSLPQPQRQSQPRFQWQQRPTEKPTKGAARLQPPQNVDLTASPLRHSQSMPALEVDPKNPATAMGSSCSTFSGGGSPLSSSPICRAATRELAPLSMGSDKTNGIKTRPARSPLHINTQDDVLTTPATSQWSLHPRTTNKPAQEGRRGSLKLAHGHLRPMMSALPDNNHFES